jgi:FSR family fosmidomycin resistance protein-like MFS transporter
MSYFAAGGSVGVFLAPAVVTPALDRFGLDATALFVPPAVLMGYLLLRHQRRPMPARVGGRATPEADRPGLFAVLTAVEVARSAVSFGVNTFVSLYWIRHLGASARLGGVALALELGGGVLGTLAGGRIADRVGSVRTVQLGNTLLVPAMFAVLACPNRYAALPLIALAGLIMNIPFAVLVKLGQDYLPSRPGTAAGVTLGLAVSAGGLFLPVLGVVADHHGTRGVFAVLTLLPLPAIALSALLREP